MKKLIRPLLATLVSNPFNRPGWVNEEKYDGFMALAYREGKEKEPGTATKRDRRSRNRSRSSKKGS